MDSEYQLVPKETEAHRAGNEPVMGIGIVRGGCEKDPAEDFRTIACDVGCLVETSFGDAFVQFSPCFGVSGLGFERETGRRKLERRERRS